VRRDIGVDFNDDYKGATVKTKRALFLLIVFGLAGLAPQSSGAERLGSYLALKGGIYSPSASFDLGNVDVEAAFKGDAKSGVDGELAFGHFFLPTFALELGAGYFKAKGSFDATGATGTHHRLDFNVIPIIVSAKAFIPAGPVDPYGELGIGAYITDFTVNDNTSTFSGTTTFGAHAGAGLNINFSPHAFIGVEGRYVWANPSFGDQKIKLNDTEYTLNGFKLNGFTTTLALGYSF
jgi:outer membrane protein W